MIKNIIIALLSLGAMAGLFLIVGSGLVASEIVECIKWQEQAKAYANHYYTDYEIEQCEAVAPETLTSESITISLDTTIAPEVLIEQLPLN